MALTFSADSEKQIDELLRIHETRESCSIPVLWIAQRQFGWISPEVKDLVAARLGISRQLVEGVVSFYTQFLRRPVGRWHFQVCMTLSCSLCNADNMLRYLEKKLGVKVGDTSADGRFTISKFECLGSCGTAPVLLLNERLVENVTPAALDKLIAECR